MQPGLIGDLSNFETAIERDAEVLGMLYAGSLGQGAVWSAMEEIAHRNAALYMLLAGLRGRQSFGFRYVEALLSPAEQAMLTDAWPSTPTQTEVRRAGHALWTWTRHVWAETERRLGRPLDVTVDEAGLLAAVDRIYA